MSEELRCEHCRALLPDEGELCRICGRPIPSRVKSDQYLKTFLVVYLLLFPCAIVGNWVSLVLDSDWIVGAPFACALAALIGSRIVTGRFFPIEDGVPMAWVLALLFAVAGCGGNLILVKTFIGNNRFM